MLLKNALYDTSSFLVIALFLYAGSSKLLAHRLFLQQLQQMGFRESTAVIIAVVLPLSEISTGLLIAFRRTLLYGWWLATLLMTGFTAYVFLMLVSKSHLPCTCGGVIASLSWKQHLWFNIFFMLLSWLALYHCYRPGNKTSIVTRK